MENTGDKRLINLYGHTLSILDKNPDFLSLLFLDDHHGKLVCTVPCESILYRDIDRLAKYHLQVELQGKTRVRGTGKSYTKNHLVVRKVSKVPLGIEKDDVSCRI